MEQGEVAVRLLGPPDQDGAEAVQPGVCAFNDPASCLGSGAPLGPDLLATCAQVQGEPELGCQCARLVIVEALIEAEVLGGEGASAWAA